MPKSGTISREEVSQDLSEIWEGEIMLTATELQGEAMDIHRFTGLVLEIVKQAYVKGYEFGYISAKNE